MKLHSLTKLLVATALLLGVTAATSKPATAEHNNTGIVCVERSPDSPPECDRSLETEVESCDRYSNNSCENQYPQSQRSIYRRQVERRVYERPQRPDHPRDFERGGHPRPQRPTHPRQSQNRKPTTVAHRFYCESGENGVPTTFVTTPQGTYPVIRWVSDYFSPHGYDQGTRCRQVSDKFQTYFNDGNLNYITTGIINHQPVICVSDTKGGTCQGVLFTLKPEENASRIIQQLFDLRSGAASGPLEESGSRLYLDFNRYIEDTIFNTGN